MRRAIFLVLTMFLLASCDNIQVKDFGPYWNRGTIDPALLGWWETHIDKDLIKIRVMNRSATYQIDPLDKKGWEHPEDSQRARTLQVGQYIFMMIKRQDRSDHWIPVALYRYKIEGDELHIYILNTKSMRTLLAKKYPKEKNITAGCKGNCFAKDTISVNRLDDSAYRILSNIPDTKEFWSRRNDAVWQRIL